jgi:hypothetical protein
MDSKSQQKNPLERKLAAEALALLNEAELLTADNEYGWASWYDRAIKFLLRERLYQCLRAAGIDDIEDPPEDESKDLLTVYSELIIKYGQEQSDG